MAPLYIALLHHPVYNKHGAVVTTAVTSLLPLKEMNNLFS